MVTEWRNRLVKPESVPEDQFDSKLIDAYHALRQRGYSHIAARANIACLLKKMSFEQVGESP